MSAEGMSDYAVATALDLPRSTVQHWRRDGGPTRRPPPAMARPYDAEAYSYLLGLYLGDGHICRQGRAWRLTISLDARYTGIVAECRTAVEASLGRRTQLRLRRGAKLVIVYHRDLPRLFPQHGPGRKHARRIWLARWQRDITERHAREFIRGLIHSDGSRCVNRFSVKLPSGRIGRYAYPRYFFTNLSADIRGIFCEHCELLGIRWTQSNPRNISISHRDSVAILDSFVGPKA